jgi:hypothetical protein
MPTHSRTVDYLKSHDSLGRRVRNLETGVHPTTADIRYWDDTNWELLTLTEDFDHAREGLIDLPLMWRRRLGIVHLRGGVEPAESGTWASIPAEGILVTTLPADARPLEDTRLLATVVSQAPYVTPAKIKKNGELLLYAGQVDAPYQDTVAFTGQSWTTQ